LEFDDTLTIDGESSMARKSKAKTARKSAGRKATRPAPRKAAKKAVKKVARPEAKKQARRPARTQAAAALQSVTPYLVVSSGHHAIEFYKNAFGAVEVYRMPAPDGTRLLHATLNIRGSEVMLSDEFPEHGGNRGPSHVGSTTVTIHLWVPDADKAFAQAIAAGASVIIPLADMFWGDRYGKLRDPFGHEWSIAHHIRDISPAEIAEAAKRIFLP
jgi:PhnB protein